ncbi:replication initiator [Streptomyces sp. NPDC001848]|uniref:replication initiator n=1 Tax=Streptomyces sp. NPDC001848 TaxID=3364618 RepID=UPI0036C486D9
MAKYVTKGASETGAGLDHKVTTWKDIDTAPVSWHVRTLMQTCWRLGSLPEHEPLNLRTWAHTLGYRGHILTKSRAYSTTYAALRADRACHVGRADIPDTVTERHWRYVGSGHTPAQPSWPRESPKTSPRTARSPKVCVRCRSDETPERAVGSGRRTPGGQVPHTHRAEERCATRAAPRPRTEAVLAQTTGVCASGPASGQRLGLLAGQVHIPIDLPSTVSLAGGGVRFTGEL